MTVISDQAPPGQDHIMRRLADLERRVRELSAGRGLEAATIGAGGITIRGGALRILDGAGQLVVQAGLLPDGTYGLAAVDSTGAAVKLSALAFGPVAAVNPAPGTRTSDQYGDLAGTAAGPSVTVTIGDRRCALVFWSADLGGTGAWNRISTGGVSVEVSGATTLPPTSGYSLGHYFEHPDTGSPGAALIHGALQGAMMHFFTGLNPGSNTFTLKYRNRENATAVTFEAREIAVFPF